MRIALAMFFWALIAFTLAMAVLPNAPSPPFGLTDKATHMLAFTVVSLAAFVAFPERTPLALFLTLAAFGALIEIVQAIPAVHRDADVVDWMPDCGAILSTLCLANLVRGLLRRRRVSGDAI